MVLSGDDGETAITIGIVFWVIMIAIIIAFIVKEYRKDKAQKAQKDQVRPSTPDRSVPMYGGVWRPGFKPHSGKYNGPPETYEVKPYTPDTSAKPDNKKGFFDWLFS